MLSGCHSFQYLMYDCIYGGRMEDEWDIRLLETFLKQICPDGILEEDGFTFDKSGTFHLNRFAFSKLPMADI